VSRSLQQHFEAVVGEEPGDGAGGGSLAAALPQVRARRAIAG
jgi:hypothetical protein